MKKMIINLTLSILLMLTNVGFCYSDNNFTNKILQGGKSNPQIVINLKKGDRAKTFICFWNQKKDDKDYFFITKNGWWGFDTIVKTKIRKYPTAVRHVTFNSNNYISSNNKTSTVNIFGCNVFCKYEDNQ